MRLLPNSKRSQQILGLSFGVIFSIILIIFFIVTAIMVIKSFLNTRDCSQEGMFVDRLKTNVQDTWNSGHTSQNFPGVLPSGIKYVCFMDLSRSPEGDYEDIGYDLSIYDKRDPSRNSNTFFYPSKETCIKEKIIPHIDVDKITETDNPYCVPVRKGKVTLVIEKTSGSGLVTVS